MLKKIMINSLIGILKTLKKANKGKSNEDIHKIAYGAMPKQSSVDENIKFFYVNGGFHYAHKFGLLTNAFGIVRNIAFVDKEFGYVPFDCGIY